LCLLCLITNAAFAQENRLIAETDVSSQTETAYDVAWNPDGELLAALGGYVLTIYDTDLEAVTPPLERGEGVNLTWSPDGDQLATVEGFGSHQIKLWDWDEDTLEPAGSLQTMDSQYVVTWSPDGNYLATLFDDRGRRDVVTIWSLDSGRSAVTARLPYSEPLRVLDWNGDHLRGAGVNSDGELILYEIDPENGDPTELQALEEDVMLFAFSPNDTKLATITNEGGLTIIDFESGDTLLTLESVAEPVNIAWHPDGETLAVLSYHTRLQLWDVSDLEN
jgi:WD40 repeat protein